MEENLLTKEKSSLKMHQWQKESATKFCRLFPFLKFHFIAFAATTIHHNKYKYAKKLETKMQLLSGQNSAFYENGAFNCISRFFIFVPVIASLSSTMAHWVFSKLIFYFSFVRSSIMIGANNETPPNASPT